VSHHIRRRDFLVDGGRAALGLSLLPYLSRPQGKRSPAETKDAGRWTTLFADLDKQIPGLMAKAALPGLSIAIIKDATVAWRRGFGVKDSTSKARVGNDTVFEAGSMSKPVFAYAVLKLCEKGVLNLDTPLSKYTSERFLQGDPRLDLITPRHVLSHSSGFQNWRSQREPLKIHFTPGEKYLYSGEGYSYLQSVVTHLTGRVNPKDCATFEDGLDVCGTDIDAYMKANVLSPFGMSSSGYVWSEAFDRHSARPHDQKGRPLAIRKGTARDAARYASAGGLHTTPTDYAKFLIEVIDPKESDAFRLRKSSVDEMVRPHVKVDDQFGGAWALGWRINPTDKGNFIGHGGDNAGFHAFAVASLAAKSGYVIMTNGDSGVEVLMKLMERIGGFLEA
jgi:CubicO group peptidase (beta-lactamase class C family)